MTPKIVLNQKLLIAQKATNNKKALYKMYRTKFEIYKAIKAETCPLVLKQLAKDLTLCEFELQKLWNFPEDINFHKFWETPKCACPKFDNYDYWGTNLKIIDAECILHGK